MAYFQTKNPNVGKLLEDRKFEDVGVFYVHFGLFYRNLVYFVDFMFISYIFPRFGILCPEKSGNPATHPPNR
jgi:hypothetical protein